MLRTKMTITTGVLLALFLSVSAMVAGQARAGEQTAAANEQSQDVQKSGDEDRIQGVWLMTSSETNTRKARGKNLDGLAQMVVVFERDKVIMYQKAAKIGTEGGYKLYPDKQPKVIDLGVPTPDGAGEVTVKGIYRLDGNKLT